MSPHPGTLTSVIELNIQTNEYMATSSSSLDNHINIIVDQDTLDKLLEIQQIEYEQQLIREEINRVDVEKQRLQDLLTILQSTKSNGRKKKPKV